jgi:maleamate amidohydrolase
MSDETFERTWEQAIESEELEIYRRAGYGERVGFGDKPALLVVDVQYDFTGDGPEPILDSIAKYSNSCGEAAWKAIPHIRRLIEIARRKEVPIIYTHSFPRPEDKTAPRSHRRDAIVDEIAPQETDIVIRKKAASPFSGTHLVSELIKAGVDTVIHTGCTTSGCVRAGVVDGAAHNFKNIVVFEGVFDRAQTPHMVNLFDMDQKYADVLPASEVEAWLESL